MGLHGRRYIWFIFLQLLMLSVESSMKTNQKIMMNNTGDEMPYPPVSLQRFDDYVVVSNGILNITFSVPDGKVTGIQYNGIDNLLETRNKPSNRGYWDVVWHDPATHFDTLVATQLNVIKERDDQVELSFTRTWNAWMNNDELPLNIDKRYIVRRGYSGFYTYAIFERLPGWPDYDLDEGRIAFKLKGDLFHYMAISDQRQRIMPSANDRATAEKLDYPEAVVLTNPSDPSLKGEVDDKYQYSTENKDNKVHGWISSGSPSVGFWMIKPSDESQNAGPLKQELTSHVGPTTLSMFFSCHYVGEDLILKFRNGEPWKKVFGPVSIYLNSAAGQEDGFTLWLDAKQQMLKERESWPYDFPQSEDYPKSNGRGMVSGRLQVSDSKDLIPANSAYIGLALPGEVGSWQEENKGYQFWNRTDAQGYFSIEHIRPGNYSLYAWVPGFIGDYKYESNIIINAGSKIDMGAIVYQPPRNGPTLWEIGIPDRTAAEFYIPDPNPSLVNPLYLKSEKFRQYGLWSRYGELYPFNDLVYDVNSSSYKKDWFFAHVNRLVENTTYEGTTWQILFNIDHVEAGDYTLQLAVAAANFAKLQVWINIYPYGSRIFTTPHIGRENTIARHGIHGLYRLYSIVVPSYLLRDGRNTIFLSQVQGESQFYGLMKIIVLRQMIRLLSKHIFSRKIYTVRIFVPLLCVALYAICYGHHHHGVSPNDYVSFIQVSNMELNHARRYFGSNSKNNIGEKISSYPPVQLQKYNDNVVIGNGIFNITLSTPTGYLTEIQYNGIDNILEDENLKSNRGYWDVVWSDPANPKDNYDTLEGTEFDVVTENEDQVEVSFKKTWTASANKGRLSLNVDKRFVVLRGSSGFYSYGIFERLAGWPNIVIYEARIAFKLKGTMFHYMAVTDQRQRTMPSAQDRATGTPLAYPEAVLLTNPSDPSLKGEVDDKYQYSIENKDNKLHGWMSSNPSIGFWVITPSAEFMIAGPVKQDLTSHVGPTSLAMFFSAHYAGENLGVKFWNGDPWKKVFGPVFIYLNSAAADQDNHHALWADAKQRMVTETESWPYNFPQSDDYPKSSGRGTVNGQLRVSDRFISKDLIDAKSAYIGLAPPGDAGSWQTENKGYQFWTQSDDKGRFSIKGVRPGEYSLYAWVPGFIGDYKHQSNIDIKPGTTIDMGAIVYQPPRNGPTLWEIGIPDRTAAEFYIPDPYPNLVNQLYATDGSEKYRQYGIWGKYAELYPDKDLVFTVGSSTYQKDWFYAHVTRDAGNGNIVGTTWQIVFDIAHVNKAGNYTLHVALAAANGAELQVRFNCDNGPHITTGLIGKDNAIARHGIHGLYWLYSIGIPGPLLVDGKNTIYFAQTRGKSPFYGFMYDYIRLEAPPESMK